MVAPYSFGVLPRPDGRNRLFFPFDRTCEGNEATLEECTQQRGTSVQGITVRGSIAVVCGGQSEVIVFVKCREFDF